MSYRWNLPPGCDESDDPMNRDYICDGCQEGFDEINHVEELDKTLCDDCHQDYLNEIESEDEEI